MASILVELFSWLRAMRVGEDIFCRLAAPCPLIDDTAPPEWTPLGERGLDGSIAVDQMDVLELLEEAAGLLLLPVVLDLADELCLDSGLVVVCLEFDPGCPWWRLFFDTSTPDWIAKASSLSSAKSFFCLFSFLDLLLLVKSMFLVLTYLVLVKSMFLVLTFLLIVLRLLSSVFLNPFFVPSTLVIVASTLVIVASTFGYNCIYFGYSCIYVPIYVFIKSMVYNARLPLWDKAWTFRAVSVLWGHIWSKYESLSVCKSLKHGHL